MKFFLLRLLLWTLVVAAGIQFSRWYYIPVTVRAFQWNRSNFEEAVKRIEQMPTLKDGDEVQVSAEMDAAGFTRIRKQGDCITFYCANLPPDSTWEIVYAPKEFRDLPINEVNQGPHSRLLHLEEIDFHWYYWELY
jgi:hypothetical protein